MAKPEKKPCEESFPKRADFQIGSEDFTASLEVEPILSFQGSKGSGPLKDHIHFQVEQEASVVEIARSHQRPIIHHKGFGVQDARVVFEDPATRV